MRLTKGGGGGEGGGSMAGGGADWGEGTNRGASSAGRGTMLMGLGMGVGTGVGAGVLRGSCADIMSMSTCARAPEACAFVHGGCITKHWMTSDIEHWEGLCAPG